VGSALLQSQLLAILSRQITEQDPQHGMTPELININMYGMFHNWVLLGGIYHICPPKCHAKDSFR